MSGSLLMVDTAFEQVRSSGPLTLTTGTADMSSNLEAGTATSLERTINGGAASFEGIGECTDDGRTDFNALSSGIDADVLDDWKDSMMAAFGVGSFWVMIVGGLS
jgi:hypothetical protein